MSAEAFIWALMGLGLTAYVLTGGADFGGGLWSLLATGPRKDEQRHAIEKAIAPIWEANHVWLIFVIVLMFTVFPRAFAVFGTALHIPVALALAGVVLRGAAFSFRAYGLSPEPVRARWGLVFAWSSVVAPLFLGASLGALSTGAIRVEAGRVTSGFLAGWTTPFALLAGVFAVALFGLLAAVYLTVDTEGEPVCEDFRRRALWAEGAGAVAALATFLRASADAPALFAAMTRAWWALPLQALTAAAAAAVLAALWRRRYRFARLAVIAQVELVVLGWGLGMEGHIIRPDVPLHAAGAEPAVLRALVPALGVGALLLAPSLWYLFRVFKGRR
jgi:cytochrome bd ubiquinol oxidase subunit II